MKCIFHRIYWYFEVRRQLQRIIPPQQTVVNGAGNVGLSLLKDASHVGMLYTKDGGLKFLHLAWDNQLVDDNIKDNYCHLFLTINDDIISNNISALCRKVVKRYSNQIPYGTGSPVGAIDANSGCLADKILRDGLTCASFVMAIFDEYWPLLNTETWKHREEDVEWQISTAEKFRKHSYHHVADRIMDNIGAFRFKPVEVFVGGMLSPPSVDFKRAECYGKLLVKKISS